jgi:colanic acid/amylovoran biosynthesis protein
MNEVQSKPLTILLFGGNVDPQMNKGDALMLLAVVARLREAFPDAELVARHGAGDYSQRSRLGLFQLLFHSERMSPRRLAEWVIARYRTEYGIRTDADLTAMINFQGYRFADFGWREVRRDYGDFKRRQRTGVQSIYLPQAYGPFERPEVRDRVSEMLNAASLVYARDALSVKYLKEIGVSRVVQCPDMTIGFPDDILPGSCSGQPSKTAYIIPNCWMLSRAGISHDEALEFYTGAISRIQQKCDSAGVSLRFMNHSPGQDGEVIRSINSHLKRPVAVVDEQDPLILKRLVRDSLFVFGSRYHSLVAALSQNVPAIGTSWAPKYEGLFSDYDMSGWLLARDDPGEQLDHLLDELFERDRYQAIATKLADRNSVLKRSVASMWDSVRLALGGERVTAAPSRETTGGAADPVQSRNAYAGRTNGTR